VRDGRVGSCECSSRVGFPSRQGDGRALRLVLGFLSFFDILWELSDGLVEAIFSRVVVGPSLLVLSSRILVVLLLTLLDVPVDSIGFKIANEQSVFLLLAHEGPVIVQDLAFV